MLFQKFGVVRKPSQICSFQMIQSIRQSHLTEMMMVAVTLSIGRDIDQLGPVSGVREPACQTLSKMLTVVEEMLESYRLRNRAVIKVPGETSA